LDRFEGKLRPTLLRFENELKPSDLTDSEGMPAEFSENNDHPRIGLATIRSDAFYFRNAAAMSCSSSIAATRKIETDFGHAGL